MGKLKYFDIQFNNRSRIYHAGEHLTGFILLDLKETSPVQLLEVSVYGKPSLRNLTPSKPGCCSSFFTQPYLIADNQTLFPYLPAQNNDDNVLEAGLHTINFSIPLPPNIPSSFESKHSKVHYFLIAQIEVGAGKVLQEKTRAHFKVMNTLDLFTFPDLQLSVERRANVALGSPIPGQGGHVRAVFTVNKGGYCPGDRVKIFGEIDNDSSIQVRKSYVELIQMVSLRSEDKVRSVRHAVTGLRHHSIPAGGSDTWDTDCLIIPELPPSTPNTSTTTISITYCLQLVIVPGGLNQRIKIPIDVIIGTCGGVSPPGPSNQPLRDISLQQMDIINTQGGRVSLALVSPPSYIEYDEPPPPYQERGQSEN